MIESPVFIRRAVEVRTNEERETRIDFLAVRPGAGGVVPGSHGLRKLRWAARGRGKRGGARVIYFWRMSANEVYVVTMVLKSEQTDLAIGRLSKLGLALRRDLGD